MEKIKYVFYSRPGITLDEEALASLVGRLRDCASECFEEVPNYQGLTGDPKELARNVICAAEDESGRILGFCSAVLLQTKVVGDVLHLGLTCVRPEARRGGLTHKLSSKLLTRYLFENAPFSKVWISNLACVISSLGNVALYFDEIHPSPFSAKEPSLRHVAIAKEISRKYRGPLAINDDSVFDEKTFIFRKSVLGTVFQKSGDDARYHHRDRWITAYYQAILEFHNGDEALQIGSVSLMTLPKYFFRNLKMKFKARKLLPARSVS